MKIKFIIEELSKFSDLDNYVLHAEYINSNNEISKVTKHFGKFRSEEILLSTVLYEILDEMRQRTLHKSEYLQI